MCLSFMHFITEVTLCIISNDSFTNRKRTVKAVLTTVCYSVGSAMHRGDC